MNTRFLIIFASLFLVTITSEYIVYASLYHVEIIKSPRIEIILMIIGVILPLILIGSMLYGYKHYYKINSFLNNVSSVWLGLMIYIFMVSIIVFILIMINSFWNFNIPIKIIADILIVIALILVTYGVINANNPRIVRWSIESEKLSKDWSGKKIVIISDVHLGTVRRENFLKGIINKIENEKPDVVFILGDLIDGPSFPYEKWLKNFDTLKPQFGNLYIEGNHEKYNQEYDKFKSQIPESINNLTDKKIIINNTQIIGFDYHQNETGGDIKKKLKSLDYDPNQSSIILIHDPKNTNALSLDGVSLVLSGHTHGGQFFPWTIVLNKMYKQYVHGISYTLGTASLTSYGVGTSIIPLRIETIPEIVVLTIK